MPRALSFCEESVKKCIGSYLRRGHVEISATYRNMRADAREIVVDEVLAAKFVAAIGKIGADHGLLAQPDAAYIASLPDVLSVNTAEEDQEAV